MMFEKADLGLGLEQVVGEPGLLLAGGGGGSGGDVSAGRLLAGTGLSQLLLSSVQQGAELALLSRPLLLKFEHILRTLLALVGAHSFPRWIV